MKRSLISILALSLLASCGLTSCTTPQPPPGGYSKEEQRAIRQEQRERRAALRQAGVAVLNFGLNAAAASLNNDEGLRK